MCKSFSKLYDKKIITHTIANNQIYNISSIETMQSFESMHSLYEQLNLVDSVMSQQKNYPCLIMIFTNKSSIDLRRCPNLKLKSLKNQIISKCVVVTFQEKIDNSLGLLTKRMGVLQGSVDNIFSGFFEYSGKEGFILRRDTIH